ncbi:hypothetical protein [Arcanobacterium hippocoleae]|uniref:ABC transporter permease n=1 Tax=Arcanobacterium hippocoleae TaxID=149017 RepID=A0ABU1T223_9ACTO|nr:hypothetical protein [Arcanobacterium hippocoleae]MDR6939320.1 hypothetical protein [Arcanobacterium hippocoleae]
MEKKNLRNKVSFAALMRHEWRLNGRLVWGFIGVQLSLLIINLLIGYLPAAWMIGLFGNTVSFVYVLSIIIINVFAVLVCVVLASSYFESMHGKYAFFTAGIPVRGSVHLFVKMLHSWVAFVLTVVTAIIASIVITVEINAHELRGKFAQMLADGVPLSGSDMRVMHGIDFLKLQFEMYPSYIIGGLILALFYSISLVAAFAFIITIGSTQRMRRFGGVNGGLVIMTIATWVCTQIIAVILTAVVPLTIRESSNSWSGFELSPREFGFIAANHELPLGMVLGVFLFIFGFIFFTARNLNRKLSL